MANGLTIVCTCRMGPGTLEAKLIPLSQVDSVQSIIVLRKSPGPTIAKVHYHTLPSICRHSIFNLILAPLILIRLGVKTKADYYLAYHYVPHFYFAGLASLITGIPYILCQTGQDVQRLASREYMGFLLRRVIQRAKRLNVPGSHALSFWQSKGFFNVQILHSTIDTGYYVPSNRGQDYDFIYIGRLERYKGVHNLIRAFKNIQKVRPDTRFAIVGYGSQEQELKDLVSSLDLQGKVDFWGFQQNVRDWLYRARIFLMASSTEGLPCSLMEAMSCGLICVCSLVGNIPDVIDEHTGFGFEAGDNDSLTSLMQKALLEEPTLDSMKAAARERIVSEHSHSSAVRKWGLLFTSLER